MAFRRQDIAKTTRKGKDGEPRRLYPRYVRDASILPKIGLAIGYLDGMVGRRRGELSADAVLESLGDAKLARCIISCLSEMYRYRTPEFAEVVGEEAATKLASWSLLTSADVRDWVYRAVHERRSGAVDLNDRAPLLAELAATLGVSGDVLDQLLHLDAERNAVLIRVAERPRPEDVVVCYNALATLSVVRLASVVELALPGLHASTVEAIRARHGVSARFHGGSWRFSGRKDAHGSWARFGMSLSRCVAQLLMLAPHAPEGWATVHFGEQSARFVLDAKAISPLRPPRRVVADADGMIRAAAFAEELASARRADPVAMRGWMIRRATEPIVREGAVVLPELIATRGQTVVPLVPLTLSMEESAMSALEHVAADRPIIGFGRAPAGLTIPAALTADPERLGELLDDVERRIVGSASPIEMVRDQLVADGWAPESRVLELFGDEARNRLGSLIDDGDAVFVDGFGLCRVSRLEEWADRLIQDRVDVRLLRRTLQDEVGAAPGLDALALHLLAHRPLRALDHREAA